MIKLAVAGIVIFASFTLCSCTRAPEADRADQKKIHGNSKVEQSVEGKGIVDVLKAAFLSEFPSTTIGKAFDNYAFVDRKEWNEIRAPYGKVYVDFNGWFKSGSSPKKEAAGIKGVQVKFTVYPDGSYGVVMVSRIVQKSDGTYSYEPITDRKEILDRVYGNREISF